MRRISRRGFLTGLGLSVLAAPLFGYGARAQTGIEPTDTPQALQDLPLPTAVETLFAPEEEAVAAALDTSNVPNLPLRVRLTLDSGNDSHADALVTADGTFNVVNAASGANIVGSAPGGQWYGIKVVSGNYQVRRLGTPDVTVGTFTGPVLVQPHDHAQTVRARNAANTVNRAYRGYLRIAKPTSSATTVWILNMLESSWLADPLEKYLYGVLPVEMPVDYGAEALKAQAVAARTYAASRYLSRADGTYIDVDDSTNTQVYRGQGVEHANGNGAVDGTRGVVATYGGSAISASYSSTCGGHTENNENVYFSRTSAGSPAAYLRGVRCLESRTPLNLFSEAAAVSFWTTTPASYCDWSSALYRWSTTWDRGTLQSVLDAHLPGVPTNYISSAYAPNSLGELYALEVVARGVSGKIKQLRIRNRAGATWEVYSDYYVRYVLRSSVNGALRNSSNMVFTHNRNGDGSLASIVARGGGWGHAVGMCQRGARGMATRGYNFAQILTHYYSGISLLGGYVPPIPPSIPTPLASPGGAMYLAGESITFRWSATGTSYHMEVATDGGTLIHSSAWMTSTTYTWGSGLGLGKYKWRVRAQTTNGTSPFSAWVPFFVVSKVYEIIMPVVYR